MVTIRVDLHPLGLVPGEEVRFRSLGGSRWKTGTVSARDSEGGVQVTDARGTTRSLPLDLLEVRRRGHHGWEPLLTRAGRVEQLRLL